VFVALYTDQRLEQFSYLILNEVPTDDCEASYLGAENIEREYNSIKTFLILFIRENEVRDIEMHISDIKSAAKSNDTVGVITAKNRLMLHIGQLRRLSTFSIEAIF
jgi:hypothetical protein